MRPEPEGGRERTASPRTPPPARFARPPRPDPLDALLPKDIRLGMPMSRLDSLPGDWHQDRKEELKKAGYRSQTVMVRPPASSPLREIKLRFENKILTDITVEFRDPDKGRALALYPRYSVARHCDFQDFHTFRGWFLADGGEKSRKVILTISDDGRFLSIHDAGGHDKGELTKLWRTYHNAAYCVPAASWFRTP